MIVVPNMQAFLDRNKSILIDVASVAALVLALNVFTVHLPFLAVTGDEVRYFLYSHSIWFFRTLVMPLEEWRRVSLLALGYTTETFPTIGNGDVLAHPIYVATLLSPLSQGSIGGLRLGGFMAGCVGLVCLYRAIRTFCTTGPAILAVATAAFAFPVIAYLRTYWIEIFIFLSISAGLLLLTKAGASRLGDACRGAVILLIPFVHLRGSVIGAVLFGLFLARIYEKTRSARRVLPLLGLAALFLAALIGLNLFIYGNLTGSVNTARPPAPEEALGVIAMQIVGLKGLFPYAPIWVLGYAGLVAGVFRRNRLVAECALLSGVALFTSIGVNPGEGWPGRFFVASVPMLTVGLAFWLKNQRFPAQMGLTALAAAITGFSTGLFFFRPNLFIEGRQSDATFQKFFDSVGQVNPGLFEPTEFIDIGLANGLGAVFFVIVTAGALSIILGRQWPALLACILAGGMLELTRVREIPSLTRSSPDQLVVTFPKPPKTAIVQFGLYAETWFVGPAYPRFDVTLRSDGSPTRTFSTPANQVVSVTCATGVSEVTIRAQGVDLAQASATRLRTYQSTSILRRLSIGVMSRC